MNNSFIEINGRKAILGESEPLDANNIEHFDKNKYLVKNGTLFDHTVIVMQNLPPDASQEMIWAALLHDVGKPVTTIIGNLGYPISPRHEQEGEIIARNILFDLKFPKTFIDSVCYAVGNHMTIKQAPNMRISKIKTMLSHPDIEILMAVSYADSANRKENLNWWYYIQSNIEQWREEILQPEHILTGADLISLGMKPGIIFGKILTEAYNLQLEGKITNKDEAITFAKNLT